MQKSNSFKFGIKKLIVVQILIFVVFSFLMIFFGLKAFYSSLLGGTICILGNICLARGFFINSKPINPKKFLHSIYVNETLKFVLTILFFAVSIKYLYIQALPFFLSYIITQNVFWFSPLLFK